MVKGKPNLCHFQQKKSPHHSLPCNCVVPETQWAGEVQPQFTEENILFSAQQAGLP